MDIAEILTKMGFDEQAEITTFKCAEDGEDYDVWKIEADNAAYVLKKASEQELAVYDTFLKSVEFGAPNFYKSICHHGESFFLMEYIEGNDLRKCDRKSLRTALDALIYLQNTYWEKRELQDVGCTLENSLHRSQRRGEYLADADLEQAYQTYLQLYSSLPRTLCHDDLLPFNVLITAKRAVLIDWEHAGILPYPVSLARLIAHGEEDEAAFFYMKEDDKTYAIEYYFENLLKDKGINYDDYKRALDYFLLFEYCEWIMLGVRYGNTGSERFKKYLSKAKEHIKRLT